MEEKEAKQKDFFASMEANIINSLSQGVVPGTVKEPAADQSSTRELANKDELPEIQRTISSMDDTVLRDLIRRQPSFRVAPQKMESVQSNLGGFESIMRDQPNRLASVSETLMFNNLPDESTMPGDLDTVDFNKSTGEGFGLTWEETHALKKLADITKEMIDAEKDGDETSPLQKEKSDLLASLKTKDTSKVTPSFSRGTKSKSGGPAFQKAKDIGDRELDFDTSDDDDDSDDGGNSPPKNSSKTEDLSDIRPEVKRRNTCGTMYVNTTMSAPDKDATIKVSLTGPANNS